MVFRSLYLYRSLPVPESAKGAFGLERDEQQGLFELSRLCIHPNTQQSEYNITSWFVSKAIRRLEKRPTLGPLSHTLIVTIILVQFIVLVTSSIAVFQNQRKISILQMELNTLEEVLKDQKVSGKKDLASTDM